MKKHFIPVSIVKDWYLYNYITYTPFKNNKKNGSELHSDLNIINVTKNNIFYFISSEKNNINRHKTFRNNGKCGNEIKNDITNVSISNPKKWISRGYN